MITNTILAWDATGEKLYKRIPGTAWEEWPVQPVVTGTAAYAMVGVKDGSILVQHPAAWQMLHWDPGTSTWINKGHPGSLAGWNFGVAAGDKDIILGGGSPAGRVAIYNGATETWTDLGSRGSYNIRPAQNCTLDDFWCIGHASADGEIFHYDGANWTTHRADMVSQLGFNPGRIANCDRIGNNLYVGSSVYGNPSTLYLSKRNCDTGVWTSLGWCLGYSPAAGFRAFSDSLIWMLGSDGGSWPAGSYIFKWNGSVLAANKYIGGAFNNAISGIGITNALVTYVYDLPTNITFETLDGGTTWANSSFPGSAVSSFSQLWEEDPVIPDPDLPETASSNPSVGYSFNIDSVQSVLTPSKKHLFGSFDDKGLVLSTERLLGETNWEYRRRLRKVLVERASSTYQGLINGITNDLGLSLFKAISINPKTDNNGRFLAADPYIKFDESYLYLYSDYSQDLLDYQIDRLSMGGNYETLQALVDFINTTVFFDAAVETDVSSITRTAGILNQSNRVSVPDETVPCSTKFKLQNDHIVSGSLYFSDRRVFKTEVNNSTLVTYAGSYSIDYPTGIVVVKTVPGKNIKARYDYTVYPFKALASPVVLHNITEDNYKVQLFQQVLQDDGTQAHQLPTALGIEIINELLSVGGLYFGK